jgi:hypothetical protein
LAAALFGENLVTGGLNSLQSKSSIQVQQYDFAAGDSDQMFIERLVGSMNERLSGGTLMSVAVATSILLWALVVGLALAL